MTTSMKVGVIGCGMLAQGTHLRHLNEMPEVELAWACDSCGETLDAVREDFAPTRVTDDFLQVLRDPEVKAVVLATTQELRLPVIEAAAAAGIAVYCEKPLAATLAEMRLIEGVVEAAGTVFCVGHNRRSAPAMQYAKEAFVAAEVQRPQACWRLDRNSGQREPLPEEQQANMLIRINDDILSWKPWVFGGQTADYGPMLFEMTHFTDLACWFMGRRPASVTALGQQRLNQTVVIRFDDGSLATIVMNGVGTFSYPKELYELYANGTAVVIDHLLEVRTGGLPGYASRKTFSLKNDPHPELGDDGAASWLQRREAAEKDAEEHQQDPEYVLARTPSPDKGHQQHLAAFLEAAAGRGPTPCPVSDAILATELAFAAIASLDRGQTVDLAEFKASVETSDA